MRFTGRPRLIPDEDSTRCMTRSTAGTSWNRRRTQAQPGLAGSGRTPPVKGVGEPCAGEPHARFDGRGLETERTSVTAPAPDPTNLSVSRTQIATTDLTALFSGGVAPPAFELRENRCETTDMADDRAPYVQSSGLSPGAGARDARRRADRHGRRGSGADRRPRVHHPPGLTLGHTSSGLKLLAREVIG